MAVLKIRGVQVRLPITAALAAPARRDARHRSRPSRPPQIRHCPDCRGPVAIGEGYALCVVCGRRRAA
jgi:hypothetical protein